MSRNLLFFTHAATLALCLAGCAWTATRPTQEMSDTAAAIQAAHEVRADALAPSLYRQSREWYLRAQQEFRLKNYSEARDYALRARHLAEEAEFESLKGGGNRESVPADPLLQKGGIPDSADESAPPPPPRPADDNYAPKDNQVYFESYEEKMQKEQSQTNEPAPTQNP